VSVRALPLLLVPLVAAACNARPPAPKFAGPVNTDQITLGMTLRLTEGGVPKATVTADTAITPAGQTRSTLRKVRLTFQTTDGQTGTLTSREGEYNPDSELMIARGNVVLVVPGEKGKGTRTIRSEELHWDQPGDRVWSTVQTRIEETDRVVITQNFTSDSRFTNIRGMGLTSEDVRVGEGGVQF